MADVIIDELAVNTTVLDEASLLTDPLLGKIVNLAMARFHEERRARSIAEDNMRLSRSAADRPDRLG
jgi:hypothetical protein